MTGRAGLRKAGTEGPSFSGGPGSSVAALVPGPAYPGTETSNQREGGPPAHPAPAVGIRPYIPTQSARSERQRNPERAVKMPEEP